MQYGSWQTRIELIHSNIFSFIYSEISLSLIFVWLSAEETQRISILVY